MKYSLKRPRSASETRSETITHTSPACFHTMSEKPSSVRTAGRQRAICTRSLSGMVTLGARVMM
jgi:hypothetical protein